MVATRKISTVGTYAMALVMFAVLVSECASNKHSNPIFEKVSVSVSNDIYDGISLNIHCKSKDDDLGEHELAHGENFQWKFRINILDSTLYWCNMWWNDVNGRLVKGGYALYEAEREWNRCENECNFSVDAFGISEYMLSIKNYQEVYQWPLHP
ncbi:hypothetical protein MKX03_019496 [Papaver bracteatum]|nr:hypothetical protein MKX03_019496 [Papaver bracteatum]